MVPPPRSSPSRSCGFGDSSWDGRTEVLYYVAFNGSYCSCDALLCFFRGTICFQEVELIREDNSLGLSIVGGSDHSSHPFGVNAPGVFISKISSNSPAARSQRLRIGDRILEVNGIDVRNAKHQAAVEVCDTIVLAAALKY